MEWEFPSTSHGISSKQIVDYLGDSVDENLTVTSEFDGDDSDCVFESSDSESEDQNTDTAIVL